MYTIFVQVLYVQVWMAGFEMLMMLMMFLQLPVRIKNDDDDSGGDVVMVAVVF